MENLHEIRDYIALSLIPGIGPRTSRKIMAQFESPEQFFLQPDRIKLPAVKPEFLGQKAIDQFRKQADKEIHFMQQGGIRALTQTDPDYPGRLKACDDAPLILYTQGEMQLNARRMVAIVGTRNATDYGQKVSSALVEVLAEYQCSLVSGLAYGIDSMAHKAADQAGIQNIAVLAHGLDRLYPAANKGLAGRLKAHGGLVTDFPSGTNPDRENFPSRNRIVAGLVDAVVVVEAAISGGALITADIAQSYNRDVFAIPGKWGERYSEGCNRIISHNKAAILTNAEDLAWYMGWTESEKQQKPVQTSLFNDLSPEEDTILLQLRNRKSMNLDELSITANIPVSKTSAILLEMEFKGIVRALPGKIYQLRG